jgi:hypothetical protein
VTIDFHYKNNGSRERSASLYSGVVTPLHMAIEREQVVEKSNKRTIEDRFVFAGRIGEDTRIE